MQKLDFNKDGKLVAYTDNGCTDGKSATTEINGIFDVSADVVKYILAKEYDLPATLRIEWEKGETYGFYDYYNQRLYCFIGNDAQQRELESYRQMDDEQKKLLQEYKHQINELSNVEDELKRLQIAIDDFNHTRRFYERKIKL